MLLSDIKTLLISIEPNVFLGEMGDAPDGAFCIYFTGGSSPVHGFDGRIFEQPSFQVRIRHSDGATAILRAEQVKDTLDGKAGLTIGSTRYLSILQTSDIMPLGKDARGRTEYTVNFQAKTQR